MPMNTSPTAAAAMIWFVRIVMSEYKNIVVLTMSPVKNTVQINIEIRRWINSDICSPRFVRVIG